MSVRKQIFTILATQPDLASAGTPQRLSASDLWVRSATIEALSSNSGNVFIGDSSANASSAKGHRLQAGEAMTLGGDTFHSDSMIFNLKEVWFDGTVNGSKLIVSYMLDKPIGE